MNIDDAGLTVVPSTTSPVTTLDPVRRAAFAEHLNDLGHQASPAGRAERTEPIQRRPRRNEAPESAAFTAACTLCRGGCCRSGANHNAFIDVEMFDRYLERNPGTTPDDAVSAYLDLVPAESVEDSCIYHSETGCTLPREMRQQICNVTRCSALHDIGRHELEGRTSNVAVSLSPDRTKVTGVATISASGTQVARLD